MLRSLLFYFFLLFATLSCGPAQVPQLKNSEDTRLTQLSQNFLKAAISGKDSATLADSLCHIQPAAISQELKEKAQKLAFWINVYNGFIQYRLRQDKAQYQNRNSFFQDKALCIAGLQMSFDDIEHGIIRGNEWKFGLGYIDKPFPDSAVKAWEVKETDPRIHFALNCGAKDCPPMRLYHAASINEELHANSKQYLMKETIVKADKVAVPKILSWYRGDFGGKKGIRNTLLHYGVISKEETAPLSFKAYDWSVRLDKLSGELSEYAPEKEK